MPDPDVLTEPAPRLAGGALVELIDSVWGMHEVQLDPLPSERDLNVMVVPGAPGEPAEPGYVLKVSNPAESRAVVDMEVAAMAHALRADPGLQVPRVVATATGDLVHTVLDEQGRPCLARLITVVPGDALEGTPITPALAVQVGALCARTSVALQGFAHPAALGRELDWDLRRLPLVIAAAASAGRLPRWTTGIDLGQLTARLDDAIAASQLLAGGVQHGDVTLTNVLAVAEFATSVIDFGDMHHTAQICDLATTMTSVLRNTARTRGVGPTTWELVDAVLRGYQSRRLLTGDDVDVLAELVLARLLLTLTISSMRTPDHGDNTAYISQYDLVTQAVLEELLALTPADLRARMHRLAGTASLDHIPEAALADRRAAVMAGPLSPTFYRRPLHIVRGDGPWLIAADGRRLLDAYNNVAVVGHAHPTVTQNIQRQLSVLNTHSRYLHRGVVELAERLVATMPAGLDTCLFTTSGTEANELAWRMATELTGGTGAVIAEHAYHGSTKWTADLSSNEWPPGHRPGNVATYAAPRGPAEALTRDDACARVARAGEELAHRGHRVALVLADCGFTSEGIHDAPGSYLHGLLDGTHRAGGLFLADEVQAGYGRCGPALWRFALAGITPDFVTLGKPMGAGYPIGALITRRDIADALARSYEYFSTFAATPVAAAAGHAVLDILQDRDLPANAVTVGDHLRCELMRLAKAHGPLSTVRLGEVRGRGLIAGVDIVDPSGQPRRDLAVQVLEGLVERGVLAGLTGPDGNVLKIRPPLVWGTEHVSLLYEALDDTLAQLA